MGSIDREIYRRLYPDRREKSDLGYLSRVREKMRKTPEYLAGLLMYIWMLDPKGPISRIQTKRGEYERFLRREGLQEEDLEGIVRRIRGMRKEPPEEDGPQKFRVEAIEWL